MQLVEEPFVVACRRLVVAVGGLSRQAEVGWSFVASTGLTAIVRSCSSFASVAFIAEAVAGASVGHGFVPKRVAWFQYEIEDYVVKQFELVAAAVAFPVVIRFTVIAVRFTDAVAE